MGTWAFHFKDEPYCLITITRESENSRNYALEMREEKGNEQCSATIRLLRIGEDEFVELESTIPKDAPPEEKMTVDGKPLQAEYTLWRITYTKDTIRVWEFEDRKTLESLPVSNIVYAVPWDRKVTIANRSSDQLQKFLIENGDKMIDNVDELKRSE